MSDCCSPKLADLSHALAGLTWSDVKCMAIHLHDAVDTTTLDKIEEERSKIDERRLYCMKAWLENDCEASWEKVVFALRRTKKNRLAEEIQSQYCAPPRSHRSRSPHNLSPAEVSPRHTQRLPKIEPTQPRSADVTEDNGANGIAAKSSKLEERFVSVVTQANINFSEIEAESPRFLNQLRMTLINLPICKKYKHMHFLKKEKDRLKAAQDVSDIFDILEPYWNHFDYKLLDYIITQFGDDKLKQTMHAYVSDLEQFEKETSIQDYIDATWSSCEIPPEFKTVLIKMDKKASECTLFDIRQFKESLANKSSLSAYAIYVKKVGEGSVVVTLAFPNDVLDVIIEELFESKFLDAHNIISISIPDIPISAEEKFDGQDALEPIYNYSQASAASGLSALSDSHISISNPPSPAIDEALLEAIACLMHQENCKIPRCPCRRVKEQFLHLLPQTRSYMQKEVGKGMEESSRGEFDPTDYRQQMRLSFMSQNISEKIHPHYHMTSHSHIRQSRGMRRVLQRKRSRSVELTPVVEQPESNVTTPAIFPEAAKGLIPSCLFSLAVTPSGKQFRVLSPTTPSAIQPPPVLLREISLSADNLPSLCLNDCLMTYTPLFQHKNHPLGSGARSRHPLCDLPIAPKLPAKTKSQSMPRETANLLMPSNAPIHRTGSTSSHESHHSATSHTSVASYGSVFTETVC